MLKIKNILLHQPISRKYSYELSKITKGDRIPLISDTMFQTMLNNESRKKYVAYLIALILDTEFDKIYKSIQFTKNKIDKNNFFDSQKCLDFLCKYNDEYFNIEMNNNSNVASLERNISYAAEIYKIKMKIGHKYNYQKVIQININNFTFKNNNASIETYTLKSENNNILTDKLLFIYIYLPNIRKKYYNKEKLNDLELLLLSFNENDSKHLETLIEGNKIMEEYREESLEASQEIVVSSIFSKEVLDDMKEQYYKEIEEKHKDYEKNKLLIGNIKTKLKNTKNLLDDTKSQLDDAKSQLDDAKSQLDDTKSQLDDTKSQLDDTKSQLDKETIKLKETQEDLKQIKKEKNKTIIQLFNTGINKNVICQSFNISNKELEKIIKESET